MDDLRAAGLDAARKRVTPPTGAAADACAWRSSVPQRLGAGDRRGALPPRPPPPPPPPRRAGAAARDAGEAGHGGRDARRGGVGKAEQVGGGSGAGASAVVARAVPGAGADAKGGNAGVAAAGDGGAAPVLAAAAVVPREGSGGGEAGSKKRAFASSTAAAPRLYPPPKRRMVSAERRYPPGCGRGVDAADDGSRFLTTAPARPGGGSTASPTKPVVDARHPPPSVGEAASGGVLEKAPAAVDGPRLVTAPASSDGGSAASRTKSAAAASRSVAEAGSSGVLKKASASVHGPGVVVTPARRGGGSAALPMKSSAPPPCSVGEAGSVAVLKKVPAAVVPRPIANAGRRGPHAAALKPLEPSCRSGVAAAADGLLDTHLQGVSDSGGFGNSKEVVRSLPKPGVMSAIRRFPPGCGRIRASQPLNNSADKCPETDSKDSSTASGSFGSKKKLIVKGPDHLQLEAKSADKCPETPSTASGSFGPKKKLIVKGPDHLRLEAKSADKCPKTESKDSSAASGSFEGLDHLRLDDVVDSILADDDFLKAEAAYQRKLELKLNGSSDARSKFKIFCGRFEFICRAIVQFVEQRSLKISRIDIAAGKVIKTLPGFTQQDPVIGNVPGVEVGDEFMYRVELALVGLHRPHQPGIDSIQDENGVLVAISIVASGGYPDELSSSGELIYTGSGGKYAGKKSDENQKLKGGNLALKNCIETKTPVRVIHGFKGSSREEGSHSRAKGASAFVYDGLYHVVDCWIEGQPGSKVFKYKLLRIPGQPELPHRSKIAPSRKTDIMC